MSLPKLNLDTSFKKWVHRNLPTSSSWLWEKTPIKIYDRILTWLYLTN